MAAAQGSAARLVEVALAEVGTIEGPKDNETKYGKFTKSNFQPWCGSFVMWCADQAGVKVPNTVYTPAGAQAFIKAGTWQMAEVATPEVGDIAYFDFPSDGVDRISHVGIVVAVNTDGTVDVVEGNTSSDKKGDQRNGGECCLKNRAYKKKNGSKFRRSQIVGIVGFGRPSFGKPVAKKVATPVKKSAAKPAAKTSKGGGKPAAAK
jgi:surface antigen